jgi:hypothetical protein
MKKLLRIGDNIYVNDNERDCERRGCRRSHILRARQVGSEVTEPNRTEQVDTHQDQG